MIQRAMLLEATQAELLADGEATTYRGFAHDSRAVVAGQCFVAIRGAHGDGHDYLDDAVANGATAVLVERDRIGAISATDASWLDRLVRQSVAVIAVDDTRAALRAYAAHVLRAWGPHVIAVAGSAGKTTTKEAIADVLSLVAPTFRSWRNYNDLLGVPLSLGGLAPEHKFAVIELAADHPGEMAALCELVKPKTGVLLNTAPTHMRYFADHEALLAEFAALPASLPADGLFVIGQVGAESHRFVQTSQARTVFSARPEHPSDSRWLPKLIEADTESLTFRRTDGATADFPHLVGAHWAYAVFAALAIGREHGIAEADTLVCLRSLMPLPGRMRLLPGEGGLALLDDTHNAIPASVEAGLLALKTLGAVRGAPSIAVLGDMLRMGEMTAEVHRQAGRRVAMTADALVARGEQAEHVVAAAVASGLPAERALIAHTAADAAQAVRALMARLDPEKTHRPLVYLKGSEEMRMEQVTALLLANPLTAGDVLDRQTQAWRHVRFMQPDRPTWLEIDLNAVARNTKYLSELVGSDVRVLVSLKADAYGHGALRVARTALHNGASWLGVATVGEAEALRKAGISAPILIFGYIPAWQAREAARLDLRATVYSLELAEAMAQAGRDLNRPVRVHVKVDTGMARLGVRAENPGAVRELIARLHELDGLQVEGLFTHFATADSTDLIYARKQLGRFHAVLDELDAYQLRPPLIHAANSAATLTLPEARFDMVRPGILVYGLSPSAEVRVPVELQPTLAFKTCVAQVKTVPAGEGVSYGATWTTPRESRLAVLPVGYADGFRRAPAHWGEVLIRGQRAPIVGRVCMDQCMIDVTDISGVREGDEVVLIGQQGDDAMTADEVAARLGTINYEVISALLPRVPRVDPTGM